MASVEVTFPGNLAQVITATDLRELPSLLTDTGTLYIVRALRKVFAFDPGSFAADDASTVIKPDDRTVLQAGRWLYQVDGLAAGAPGAIGPAMNTYPSRAALAASPVEFQTAFLNAPGDTGPWSWQVGDFSSRTDVIFSTLVSPTQGAWVYAAKAPAPVTGFFGMAFRGDNDLSYPDYWYIKPTGETAIRLNTDALDNPGEDRDPAILHGDDGYWYYFRSIGFNSASFEIRRSVQKNLVSGYQHWQTIDCSSGGSVRLAWAPSPFRDPATGKWYAEVALGLTSDPSTHYMAVVEFTASDFSSWNPPVTMGMGINYIDGSSIYSRGSYYHIQKREQTPPSGQYKYVEIWKSATYPTGWSKITTGDFLAIPADVEGPCPIEDAFGVCHLFLDANAVGDFYHTSAPSFDGPWATPKKVDKGGLPLRHGFFINIDDSNRSDIQQALNFYGVDLSADGQAKFLLQGADRNAQLTSLQAEGPLINESANYVAAPGNYRYYKLRGGPLPFVGGYDLYMAGAKATYGIAISSVDGSQSLSWKVAWDTGYFDTPMEFEPRDLFNLTLQNGWAVQDGLTPKVFRDRMGRVMITGCISKTGTPTQGEVIASLPGGFAPARVEEFLLPSSDGTGATPMSTIGVINSTLVWVSGGKTKIYLSAVQFIGVGSVTNT